MKRRKIKAELFMSRVHKDESTGCWIWQGPQIKGYGKYSNTQAHTASYQLHRGEYDSSLELDHLCRNTLCCNPYHLEPVTRMENIRRRSVLITQCKNGHEFTEENTRVVPSSAGGIRRVCRACVRRNSAAYKARRAGRAA